MNFRTEPYRPKNSGLKNPRHPKGGTGEVASVNGLRARTEYLVALRERKKKGLPLSRWEAPAKIISVKILKEDPPGTRYWAAEVLITYSNGRSYIHTWNKVRKLEWDLECRLEKELSQFLGERTEKVKDEILKLVEKIALEAYHKGMIDEYEHNDENH